MTTVPGFETRETCGFAVKETGVVSVVTAFDDAPQADKTDNTAQPNTSRSAVAAPFIRPIRPAKIISRLPQDLRGATTAGHNSWARRHNLGERIVDRIFELANLSRFCGIVRTRRRHMANQNCDAGTLCRVCVLSIVKNRIAKIIACCKSAKSFSRSRKSPSEAQPSFRKRRKAQNWARDRQDLERQVRKEI